MNEFPGLTWEFDSSETGDEVVFMDLRIRKNSDNKLETTLYEKPLNLYLYLPPHSAHPPGVIKGLIFGSIYRIQRLCTRQDDIDQRTRRCYDRLLTRGWKSPTLDPIFAEAVRRAKNCDSDNNPIAEDPNAVIDDKMHEVVFHLPYHPDNPRTALLHQAWENHVTHPRHLSRIRDVPGFADTGPLKVGKLTLAHHRAPNLGNLLSYRRIEATASGAAPVSTFRDIDHSQAVRNVRP